MEIGGENKKDIMPDDKSDDISSKYGRVIKALHNKTKLPSLRTYQGDMAEFIKNKDESVVSIVVKEKKKKQKEEKEQQVEQEKNPEITPKRKSGGLKFNFTVIILSLLLIFFGVTAAFYVFKALRTEPMSEVVLQQEIIPYNNLVTLSNITKTNFGSELARLNLENGISVLKISDTSGQLFQKSSDLFSFLNVSMPANLKRTLKDEYVVGVISQNKETSSFIIMTVNDFGNAFSAMLDWEEKILEDLSFLNPSPKGNPLGQRQFEGYPLETASTTTTEIIIPLVPEVFVWKDIIIKNKDTRGLVNSKSQAKIAYTFLDKSTILIINDLTVIGEISSVYASRAIVR